MRRMFVRLLSIVAVLALGWAAVIWLSGGLTMALAGMKLSSTTPWRPLGIGIAAGLVALWLQGLRATVMAWRLIGARLSPTHAAVGLAIGIAVAGLAGNSWTASGPDPFAYVSQAALWRVGRLDLPVPLAGQVPWPNAVATLAPFGYRAAPDGAPAVVPITAPGVPLLMAALETIAGHWAAFLVTPLAAGVLVWFTYAIGRRIRSPATGLIAAWLVATSPALLYNLMWPMADVPAAACAALMISLLLGESTASAVGAGLAAAAGTLMRPNFIVIAAGGGLWLVLEALRGRFPEHSRGNDTRGRFSVIAFGAALLPGVGAMLWLNARWFGSAFASGYGTAGELFSIARIGTNAAHYARWLAETSPLAFVGLGALFIPLARVWPGARARRAAWLLMSSIVSAGGVYLLYQGFTDWWYLRFLLPAWPAFFVAAAAALEAIGTRGRLALGVVVLLAIAAGIAGVSIARARGVFELGAGERRYVTIARLVDANTEPTAVILTCQHSGTVLYYAGRDTVRFDILDPAWLDRAVDWLASHGRHPYILIEDWEQPIFERQFRSENRLGDLSFPPALAWQSARNDGYVWLFDALRRDAATVQPGPDIDRGQPLCARPATFPKD